MALLTAEQLARLRDIIRDASTSLAVSTTGMEVSDEDLQRLVNEGYVDPEDLHNIVLDSFEYGRLMQQLPGARHMGYQQFINYLAHNPVEFSDQERRAFEFLQSSAGQFCVGLGTRAEGELALTIADMNQQLAAAFRYSIQDEAGMGAARRESIGQLTTRLRQMSDDWARDWGRTASTESQIAHQMGYIESVAEQYGQGEMYAKIPEPTACPDCLRLYLEDGKPMVRPIEWWQRQGVANYGLKRADWKPVMGACHPFCQCRGTRVPAGWWFDESWDLVPLEETEKSDRPTLTVQTFQKSHKLHYRTTLRGLPISIENRRGSKRYWYDPHTDTKGETLMRFPYGYLRMTEGADLDHVDCYLGPHEDATHVYVVHQMKAPHFKEYDEDKVMLGFLTAKAAKRAYLQHYDSPRFFGSMDSIPIERFVEKVKTGVLAHGKKIQKAKPVIRGKRPSGNGWAPIPHTSYGGYRRRRGAKWEYWYPGKLGEHEKEWEKLTLKRLAQLERSQRMVKLGGEYHIGDGRYLAVFPDASSPGKVRIQEFDARGFSGHQTFDTMEELIEAVATSQKLEPAPGILDELAAKPEWTEGMAHTRIIQKFNSLPWSDMKGDVWGALNNLVDAKGPEAAADTLDKVWGQIVAGTMPSELAAYVQKSRADGPLDDYVAVFIDLHRARAALLKGDGKFGGFAGNVGIDRPIGTMGNVGKPARTPGANTWTARAVVDHSKGPAARRKKAKKKKRKKQDRSEEKAAIAVSPVRYTDGYVRDKPHVDALPKPDPERGRKWLDDQQEKRARGRDTAGRLTVRPQDTR